LAGFRKAKAEQAALKMSLYGPPGSGKTLTTLLIAEGIAKLTGKRIAFVDTEHGADFYTKAVPERTVHPEPFDFDVLHTRSLTETVKELKALNQAMYGVVVVDSITHLWEAAKASYTGPKTKAGTLPMHAWGKIKAPYKDLMAFLINSPMHAFILGRQGNEFVEDEETGEIKAAGVKMKAEGETAYEPHICLRMEPEKDKKRKEQVIYAFAEKDRTGILSGKTIMWPCFNNIAKPLMALLGGTQAQLQSEDEAALQDSEAIAKAEREKDIASQNTRERFVARFRLADSKEAAEAVGKEITASIKKDMAPADVTAMKVAYLEAVERIKKTGNGHSNGHRHDEPGAADKEDKFRQIQEAIPAVNSKTASNMLWEQINSQRDWLGAEAVKTLMDHLMQHNAATWNKPKASKPEPAAALLPAREPGDDSDDDR